MPGGPASTGYLPITPAPAPAADRGGPPRRSEGSASRRRRPSAPGPSAPWQPVLAWTIALFTVPMLAYLGWAWTRSETAVACVNVADGACLAPRTAALTTFADAFPGVVAAAALSAAIAAGLRLLDYAWRPVTIALGSSVIGAGVTTIVVSALG